MNILRTAVAVALAVVSVVATGVPAGAQAGTPDEIVAGVGADGIQRAEVLAGSYFFKPARVVVKLNVPVELSVRKEPGAAPHDVVVKAPDAGIDFAVDLGTEPKVIAFTPTRAGVYPMYCSKRFLFFASHRDRGMEGVLDVRE